MDREYVENGAYYISLENKATATQILHVICKKLGLLTSDVDQLINPIQNKKILFMIDNCQKALEKSL